MVGRVLEDADEDHIHHDGGSCAEGDGIGDGVQVTAEVVFGAESPGSPSINAIEHEAQEDEGRTDGDVPAVGEKEVYGKDAADTVGDGEDDGDARLAESCEYAHWRW